MFCLPIRVTCHRISRVTFESCEKPTTTYPFRWRGSAIVVTLSADDVTELCRLSRPHCGSIKAQVPVSGINGSRVLVDE